MPRLPLVFLLGLPALASASGPTISLREATDRALRLNLGLAVTRVETGKADDAIEVTKAVFDPTFGFNTGLTQSRAAGADYVTRAPRTVRWNNDASLTKKFSTGTVLGFSAGGAPVWGPGSVAEPDISTSVGVSVRQPLLKGAGETVNLAPLARAKLNLERTRVNLRVAAADLLTDTAVAYRNLAAARELLALRESALKSSESLLTEIRVRRRPGVGTATVQDELEAAADVASRRVEVAEAGRAVHRAADTLRRLTGDDAHRVAPDAAIPTVEALPATAAVVPPFAAYMAAVDAFNPETTLRDLDIRDADTQIDAAKNADSASLDLVAGARTLGRDDSAFGAIDGMRRDPGHELAAGLQFTLPLGMRESEAQLRTARRARDQAVFRQADARRRAGYDARAAWRDLVSARERLEAAESGLTLQAQVYAGARARHAAGAASLNDVLLAAARLDRARLDRLSALLDCSVADIRQARLDGAILTRLGYKWEELDESAAAGLTASEFGLKGVDDASR